MDTGTLYVGAGRLATWYVAGPRPPVVCVHGAGVSSRESLPFLAQLESVREAWSVDFPGFGRSTSTWPVMGMDELVRALVQFLDGVSIPAAHFVGWSFGCQIAVELAARFPERVLSVTLVGPTVDPAGRSFLRQFGRWLRNSPYEPLGLGMLVMRDYRDAGPRRVISAFSAALADKIEDKLPEVRVPAMVVRGERDRMAPQEWAEEVTRMLPNGTLVTWPNAGHMVPFSHPAAFAEAVARFASRRCV